MLFLNKVKSPVLSLPVKLKPQITFLHPSVQLFFSAIAVIVFLLHVACCPHFFLFFSFRFFVLSKCDLMINACLPMPNSQTKSLFNKKNNHF